MTSSDQRRKLNFAAFLQRFDWSIIPIWLMAIATITLAIVAVVNFPPLARIDELETRERALLNNIERLKVQAAGAEKRSATAQSNVALAQAKLEQLQRDAELQSRALQADIKNLTRERRDLRRLVDLYDRRVTEQSANLNEKQEAVTSARMQIDSLRQARRDTEASFRRYVVGLVLTRVRGKALQLAVLASYRQFQAMRDDKKNGLSPRDWPFKVWVPKLREKGDLGKTLMAITESPELYGVPSTIIGSVWEFVALHDPTTGRRLLKQEIRTLEFQELPKEVRRQISQRIQNFIRDRDQIFSAKLEPLLGGELILPYLKMGKGTTGDPDKDRKIVAELKRHETSHRALGKALEELERDLLAAYQPTSIR